MLRTERDETEEERNDLAGLKKKAVRVRENDWERKEKQRQ